MCKHKKLIYIGKQAMTLKENRFLYLFNCVSCKTTVSLPVKKRRRSA